MNEERFLSQDVAGRRLDQNHVGAEIAEQPGREGT